MDPRDLAAQHLPAAIPALVVVPDRMQLFMFSAATWNRHRIHYDKDEALAEGLPDVVVQRALLGDFLARMLTDWLGDAGDIRRLSWRVVGSALPDVALSCTGNVVALEQAQGVRLARCDLRLDTEAGDAIATGDAIVRLYPEEQRRA